MTGVNRGQSRKNKLASNFTAKLWAKYIPLLDRFLRIWVDEMSGVLSAGEEDLRFCFVVLEEHRTYITLIYPGNSY